MTSILHRFMMKKVIPPTTGGHDAREQAERDLARVQGETAYYAGLGSDLRDIRRRNHFADSIRTTMMKGA